MRSLKTILLFLVILTLTASVLQSNFELIREKPLKGYYPRSDKPGLGFFSKQRWFSGEFQEITAVKVNNNIGFRISCIRLFNQVEYSLFGLAHAKGFTVGKRQYLFEEEYIHEYLGHYFIGKKAIDGKLSQLKNVSDSLSAYHIPLILVYEPGKASFYPEYIPARFHAEKRTLSNYDYFVKRSGEFRIPFLDLNSSFLRMKDTTRYPLFPKYGMHWSIYGSHIAADTLSKYIACRTGSRMPAFRPESYQLSDKSPGTDYDIGDIFNLALPLAPARGIYPVVPFNSIPPGTLSALIIADSYYINLVETYGRKMFASQEYWYYNNKLYPGQNLDPPVYADKSDLKKKLLQHNVIMLMVSEINLHCGFWNFADEAYLAFHPEKKADHLYDIENSIRNDREWFRSLVQKAKGRSRPLETFIRDDAEFIFYKTYRELSGKTSADSIQYIRLTIKNSPEWLAQVIQKARDRHITPYSMMMLDAVYTFNQLKKKQ